MPKIKQKPWISVNEGALKGLSLYVQEVSPGVWGHLQDLSRRRRTADLAGFLSFCQEIEGFSFLFLSNQAVISPLFSSNNPADPLV